jgi:hypothetical protein
LFGEYDEPFQLGTGAYLWLPTGAAGSFVGEGAVRVTPYVSMGGAFQLGTKWWWTVHGGAEIRGGQNPSKIRYGAGLAAVMLDEHLQIGPEVFAATPIQESANFELSPGNPVGALESTNVELLLGARARVWRFTTGMAGGPGLTRALGTPAFRLLGTISYDPLPRKPDRSALDDDNDSIVNKDDACPYAFGEANTDAGRNGCPSYDDDEDGIPNDDDACPDEHGQANPDPKRHGCRATP